jgi:hypothetical protein
MLTSKMHAFKIEAWKEQRQVDSAEAWMDLKSLQGSQPNKPQLLRPSKDAQISREIVSSEPFSALA